MILGRCECRMDWRRPGIGIRISSLPLRHGFPVNQQVVIMKHWGRCRQNIRDERPVLVKALRNVGRLLSVRHNEFFKRRGLLVFTMFALIKRN